jgi:hypothetical protein
VHKLKLFVGILDVLSAVGWTAVAVGVVWLFVSGTRVR